MKKFHTYQTFQIELIRRENSRTNSLIFDQPLSNALPGQFVMVWLPGIGEKPYSILDNDPFSLAVTSVGIFSTALMNLKAGSRIWVRGPLGQGFRLSGNRHLLAGGGYGAAPLLFLAKEARNRKDEVKICLGARTEEDLMLVEEFKSMGCGVFVTTNDGSQGEKGLVTDTVETVRSNFTSAVLYACGPVAMLSALTEFCIKENLPSQLSWEANMRCGIGLCGSCELDEAVRKSAGIPAGWLTCKDGPVYINS